MALAAAQRLANSYDLHIAVLHGPLRDRFAAHGRLLRASPTVNLAWGSGIRWLVQVIRSMLDAVRIAIHVRRHRVCAVYTNSTVLLGPVVGARLAGVPAIVHARELPGGRRGRRLFAALGALADTVIPVSNAVQDAFADARRAHIVRIYDGIPVPPEPHQRRGDFHTPARLCLIGTVGGDRRKGQDVAIDALARLAGDGVEAQLQLVGPIQDEEGALALENRARALGVWDHVHVIGTRDRVEDIITQCDILLSCAREEPLGLTVMEALARETPVVASRVGGVPEIVQDGETGLLVAPDDPEDLARAIGFLLAAPATARVMAQRGRADIAARFDRADSLAALERLLAQSTRTGQSGVHSQEHCSAPGQPNTLFP